MKTTWSLSIMDQTFEQPRPKGQAHNHSLTPTAASHTHMLAHMRVRALSQPVSCASIRYEHNGENERIIGESLCCQAALRLTRNLILICCVLAMACDVSCFCCLKWQIIANLLNHPGKDEKFIPLVKTHSPKRGSWEEWASL